MNGYRLRLARGLRRLTQTQLAERAATSQATIAKLESGQLEASADLLERLTLQIGFPVAFLLGSDSVELPEGSLLLYRKKAKLSKADQEQIYNLSQLALTAVVELRRRFKPIATTFPVLCDSSAKDAAGLIRNALGVKPGAPVERLIQRLEASGVICLALPLGDDCADFDAFSALAAQETPVIAYHAFRPTDRVRMSVAHEAGHLALHGSAQLGPQEVEAEAYEVAGEVLLPSEEVLSELTLPITVSELLRLKRRWGVSIAALIQRARHLNRISVDQQKRLFIKLGKLGWRQIEPGSEGLAPEKPRLFARMFDAVYHGDAKAFADTLGYPTALVEALLAANGVAPSSEPSSRGQLVEFSRLTPRAATGPRGLTQRSS
ncbi:MAG: ImmA/IrrE family metallo-endopeptidase [Holophagales bacterium]|nr:MAG: ImmA/IrrE family metallo-endopeptidase [Holophagales bacterium]